MLEHSASSGGSRAAAGPSRSWWRVPLGALSPAGLRGRLTIVIFHRVHAQPDPLFPGEMDAAAFRERLTWLRDWFNVLSLDDGVASLVEGTLPARALAITFDDGYADNVDIALPILTDLGLHATFFIATGFLDGGRMWNDTIIEAVRGAPGDVLDLRPLGLSSFDIASTRARRGAIDALLPLLKHLQPDVRQARVDEIARRVGVELPRNLMMSSPDVRRLASAGMALGAHTVSHPILCKVDAPTARREIAESRELLEGIVRQPVRLFAYPNGRPNQDYAARDVEIARALGFRAACSTASGAARCGDSLFELPRFTPWGHNAARWGARLAQNYFRPVVRAAA
jgi:peptidoglycan/xylan/chitin deacetylase (PgdA/CDA1 family)